MFSKVLHLLIRILIASVKITFGGRAPVDSIKTAKREKYNTINLQNSLVRAV